MIDELKKRCKKDVLFMQLSLGMLQKPTAETVKSYEKELEEYAGLMLKAVTQKTSGQLRQTGKDKYNKSDVDWENELDAIQLNLMACACLYVLHKRNVEGKK